MLLLTLMMILTVVVIGIMSWLFAGKHLSYGSLTGAVTWSLLLWLLAAECLVNPKSAPYAPIAAAFGLVGALMRLAFGLLSHRVEVDETHFEIHEIPTAVRRKPKVVLRRDESKRQSAPVKLELNDYFSGELVTVSGEINDFSAGSFARACYETAKKQPRQVTIQIQTLGGRSHAGLSMFSHLRLLYEAIGNVNVVVTGYCHSAGVSLLMAVPMDRRFATRESTFMIHPGSVCDDHGNPVSILTTQQVDNLQKTNDSFIVNLISENSAIQRDSLIKLIDAGQEAHLSAEEAYELGLIGGII